MSSVGTGAFSITCESYLPQPSCVIPRLTGTPIRGISVNLIVLLGVYPLDQR